MFPLSHFLCPQSVWDTSVDRLVLIWPEFGGGPFFPNYITINYLLPQECRFVTWHINCLKKHIPVYKWREVIVPFGDIVLGLFFRISTKRLHYRDFSRVKNASKNDRNCNFWTASWAIRIPWTGFQTGTQNHAKLRQNTQKSPQNEHGKLWITLSQLQKIHPIAWRARTHQNANAFAVPAFALLGESVQKSRKLTKKAERNSITEMDTLILRTQNCYLFHRIGERDIRRASGHMSRWYLLGDFPGSERISMILECSV